MQKTIKSILVFFGVIFIAGNIAAQTNQRCKYTVYNRQTGMADQIIKDFTEDNNGFIWMLGENSLQWFDGSRFHEVLYGTGIHQLPGIVFLGLHKTKENEIWIFYRHGFSVYNEATHSFTHYTSLIPLYKNLALQPVVELDKDFIVENGAYKFYINKKTKKIVKQQALTEKRSGDGFAPLNNLQNPEISFSNNYVFKYNYFDNKRDTLFYLKNVQPFKPFIINQKQFLIFDDSQVKVYDTANFVATKTIAYPNAKKLISYQRPVNIIRKNKTTALVILDDELWEFDLTSLQFTRQLVNLEDKHFFTNGYFKNIFYDSKGNLWVGSNLNGVFKINTASLPVQLIKSNIEKDNFVKCFAVNNITNKIIVGTYGSGLQVYDTLGNHLKGIFITDANQTSANIISSIGKIDEDNYLVLVFNNPTQFILNTKNLTLLKIKTKFYRYTGEKIFQPNYYSDLIALGNKKFYYLKNAAVSVLLTIKDSELIISDVNLQDTVVLQTYNSFNIKNQHVDYLSKGGYFNKCISNAQLLGLPVSCISKWSNNWLIGTARGIYLFNKDAQLLNTFNKQTGLPDETINAIIIDKENNAWCSHNKGISKLQTDGPLFNLSKDDGLQDDEFNYGAAAISNTGKIYFGGINGISAFYPSQLPALADTPRLMVTGISTYNNSIVPDTAFWNIKNITLSYKDNQLKILFAALGKNPSAYYNFQYRIASINNKWIDLKHQEQINLALQPGTYTIEFAVNHQFDKNRTAQKSIRVIITPPYYQRWWFITLLALAFAAALWYLLRWLNKRKYLKQLQQLKMQEELETERQRISRDLHDNMGAYTSALIANVEKLKATNTEEEELDKMKVNADQILSSLRETIWVLNNKEVSLADFSDGFKNYCFKILKNFEHIDFDAEEDIIENKNLPAATAIHLNKILQEALQNIIKHSKATTIIYSIKCSGKFKIQISDNGIGFDAEKISRGNGLENIAWRAKEAGVDLLHQSYPKKGTSITITEI